MNKTDKIYTDINRFIKTPPIAGSPNRNPNLLHIFTVNISTEEFEGRNWHDDEIAMVELFSLEEVVKRLDEGDIYVAVSVAVLSRYIIFRRHGDRLFVAESQQKKRNLSQLLVISRTMEIAYNA